MASRLRSPSQCDGVAGRFEKVAEGGGGAGGFGRGGGPGGGPGGFGMLDIAICSSEEPVPKAPYL